MEHHHQQHQEAAPEFSDNLATILERASRKLQEEITPIDALTHNQAILEQRLRLVDEALKKLTAQQLRLGIEDISRQDLIHLLEAASQQINYEASDEEIKSQVQQFLSSF